MGTELFTCQVKINAFSSSLDGNVFDCKKKKKKNENRFDSAKNIKVATFSNYDTVQNIEFIIDRLKLRF